MTSEPTKLTALQLELLKLFARNPSEEELTDIKSLIARYYAERADKEMDKLWEQNGWTADEMREWASGKMRTPYNPDARSDANRP